MMPLLKTERRTLSEADIAELQPILTHIREVLCAGSTPDYESLMAWLAHVVQDPAEKTGWCPVIISNQGTGKGMIFSSLVGGIFAELGLHVTNFDSVVSRFNDELSMKSFVLVDEGM
jgi:hypothetical protein